MVVKKMARTWQVSQQIEQMYKWRIQNLKKVMSAQIKKANDVTDITTILGNLHKYKDFTDLAEIMAGKMVTMVNEVNEKTWRSAAAEQGQGRTIYERLQKVLGYDTNVGQTVRQLRHDNAQLIKTLPFNVVKDVMKFVNTEAYKGLRSSEIAKVLHIKIEEYTDARAGLIARTETSKAMTALTEARSKDVGLRWYIWRTANDGLRVRPSHRLMKDVICNYDEPPAPEKLNGEKSAGSYSAGNIYNCRCFPRPLLSLSQINWPAKVYYMGSIKTMTKAEFASISHMEDLSIPKPIQKIAKKAPEPKKQDQEVTWYQMGQNIMHKTWFENFFGNKSDSDIMNVVYSSAKASAGSGERDVISMHIYKEQGFDKLPKLEEKEDLDALVKEGHIEMFRGVGSTLERGQVHVKDFRQGEYYPGKGVYGNGTYCAAGRRGRSTAVSYANFNEENVMRMVLLKDAKVISHDDLMQKQYEEKQKFREKLRTHGVGKGPDLTSKERAMYEIIEDEGKLAALMGYDAIHVPHDEYYVVLNRTALHVEKQQPFTAKNDRW
jgi:hypothetical protein